MTGSASESGSDPVERIRLQAVESLDLLDTPAEERFDRITRVARELFDVPVAEINLIAETFQFTKSPQRPGQSSSSVRTESFCDITIQRPDLLVVPDATLDERFAHKTTVTGPRNIRFYAGRPLSIGDNLRVGTLCLVDTVPRQLTDSQLQLLEEMAQWAERELRDTAELDRAIEVQQSLLPRGRPGWPEYEVAGVCLPLRSVGGDFYDWHEIDGGVEFTLADVMGKGTAAAIIASAVRSAFQARVGGEVAWALNAVNAQVSGDLGAIESFATLLHARLDFASGRLVYVDAGHGLTVLLRADGTLERLGSTGLPLGLVPDASWSVHSATLSPGDCLVAFTDGLLDLFGGTLDSLDEVGQLVRSSSSPADFVERVGDLVFAASGSDDVSVVAITRH